VCVARKDIITIYVLSTEPPHRYTSDILHDNICIMCKRQVQYNRIPITRMLNAMPIYKKNPAGTDSKTDLALPYAEARR